MGYTVHLLLYDQPSKVYISCWLAFGIKYQGKICFAFNACHPAAPVQCPGFVPIMMQSPNKELIMFFEHLGHVLSSWDRDLRHEAPHRRRRPCTPARRTGTHPRSSPPAAPPAAPRRPDPRGVSESGLRPNSYIEASNHAQSIRPGRPLARCLAASPFMS